MNRADPQDSPRIVVEPACRLWASLADRSFATLDERARRFREELGLPTDRPVIVTGHQAEWWHAGVLAKFLAVDAVARRSGMAQAWIIPDQDEAAFDEIPVPLLDAEGRLTRRTLRLTTAPAPGTAAGAAPAFDPTFEWPERSQPALASVARGVERIVGALRAERSADNAARQVIAALGHALAPIGDEAKILFATSLSGTGAFRSLVERFAADPRGASESYNRAVKAHPDARIAPLQLDGPRVELPLWRIRSDGRRQRVNASDLAATPPAELAPRALVLTGLMRWGACDLFVHGTGGAAYDPITEAWFADWLGATLAPVATVTADLLLPLPGSNASDSDAARAAWAAHGARHNPGLVDDNDGQSLKRLHLDAIDAAPRRSAQRDEAYRALHRWLDSHRSSAAERLAALDRRAASLRASAAERAVARDRTWPFFLHEPESIEALRESLCAEAPRPEPCGAP